jgi:protoheme IX farnesyltransferase
MARYRSDNLFQIILELSKVRITIAVSVTTITGYILARNGYDPGFILPTLGIFFLACGSSVINHLQEKRTDAIMARTRLRPIPAYKISLGYAVIIAAAEIIAGSALLLFNAGIVALCLGLFAMIWYNFVYTNLKRKTPHAVIPGSVIGSIPPLVGWVAAHGDLLGIQPLMMAIFFFIWQVPHFYLLAFKYGHEYEEAGLPTLTKFYSVNQIKNIVFIWIVFTALAATGFSLSRPSGTWLSTFLILVLSIWLVYRFSSLLQARQEPLQAGKFFMKINYYVLAIITILVADPIIQKIL